MTTRRLQALLPVALDMSGSLPTPVRAQRLVDAARAALGSDAVALLRAHGEELRPIAESGLSPDLLGRRFPVAEHPRLRAICEARGPIRFDADSPLPDPFDGLIGSGADPRSHVHACVGGALRVDGELLGVLTADALDPRAFADLDDELLAHVCALAGAALRTIDLISALEDKAARGGQVARELIRDALERRGGLLLGSSNTMQRLRDEIDMFAGVDIPVLVTGETGVGKELVVRTLHARSLRSGQPLIYTNCAALPESIAESELFGHVKGAFTGAESARSGKFGIANGASLFLDEVGELPVHVQPKLLRALQDGELQRVGSDTSEHVDVRVLAATNRDLEREVHKGRFRADLLHRLDVGRIHVPALREHQDDVPQLAGHFADLTRRRLGCGPVRFEPEALDALAENEWPGNVRELENVVSRAVLRAAARTDTDERVLVGPSDLDVTQGEPTDSGSRTPSTARDARTLRESVEAHQRARIRDAVAAQNGNWSAAARELGLARANLHRLARRLGLK